MSRGHAVLVMVTALVVLWVATVCALEAGGAICVGDERIFTDEHCVRPNTVDADGRVVGS